MSLPHFIDPSMQGNSYALWTLFLFNVSIRVTVDFLCYARFPREAALIRQKVGVAPERHSTKPPNRTSAEDTETRLLDIDVKNTLLHKRLTAASRNYKV